MPLAYLSLGSNLGDREAYIHQALNALDQTAGRLVKCSSLIETAPWGFESSHSFVNSCAVLETKLSPMELLRATQAVERSLGRTHKSHDGHYGDRTIDIDILLYDAWVVRSHDLILPHPLMAQRYFVLKPLCEIAPSLHHPLSGLTVSKMLARL